MSYAIMRFEKRQATNVKGMENHNERKTENHSNEEIETDKSHLNYDLVSCSNYKEAIDKELSERYTKKTAIRKDAVVATEFLFTSDKEFFDKLSPGEEKKYFEECLDFLKDKFGEKNIISAKVHKDEKTPHLHAVVVPLHDDGSLSMKKYVDSKKDLIKLQDSFFEKISKEFPQLERGQSKTITESKHKDLKELKKETNYLENQIDLYNKKISVHKEKIATLDSDEDFKNLKQKYKENVEEKTRGILKKETYYEVSNTFINTIIKSLNHVQDAIKITQENVNLKKLEENYFKLSSEYSQLKNEMTNLKKMLEKPLVKEAIEQQKDIDFKNVWKKKLEKDKKFELSR